MSEIDWDKYEDEVLMPCPDCKGQGDRQIGIQTFICRTCMGECYIPHHCNEKE